MCSDADLRQPRPGRPGQEVWETVPGNAHLHLAEHPGYLYAEAGDAAAAETAALWAHELDNRAFPSVNARATAAYNLSCFYARAGRAADALGHLELAVSLNSHVVEWARGGADLDSVRDDPRIAVLRS